MGHGRLIYIFLGTGLFSGGLPGRLSAAEEAPEVRDPQFVRGDVNADTIVQVNDAIGVLNYLFLGTESIDCKDTGDANDDGAVDIGDSIRLLFFLFLAEEPPPRPFPGCGPDATADQLSCESYGPCGTPPLKKNLIGMEFVYIPPGTFTMGSATNEKDRFDDELQHEVTISCGFYLGKYEVTEEQYELVMGLSPWKTGPGEPPSAKSDYGPNGPARDLSWFDAVEFCRRLSQREGTKFEYRLPTEAEWEYACRAGTQTRFSFGDGLECKAPDCGFLAPCLPLGAYAWGDCLAIGPVDAKRPNPWGLYGMHGNLGEWCHDWYGPYPNRPVIDPTGPETGSLRVVRATELLGLKKMRSAARLRLEPRAFFENYGFRVVQKTPCQNLGITP